ncbi:complement factor H-like isoform X6 [Pimephales promelas]|uniref:complement factor H-like isoform X6 n=1 Tax=Pimephales promelas TaxID=90988 RepID=UPI001955E190|nr:complement factor H-like isoform X6 [Pimephales promelas]
MRAPVKLLGFVFWLFSLNFAQSQALASQTMKVPALGRPLFPGMLYDCRKDTFIPGVTLWDKKSLIEDLDSRPQSRTDLKFSSSDSLSSKSSLLDVTASLKASFLGGLVEVGGSAMFLRNTKSSNQQSRVTMYYSESTRFEQLTMSHLGQITYPQVFDQKTATHVVTGVLYGAQAIMVFDRTFSEEEEKQEIEGELNVMVKKIPLFSIEGQGAVKMTDGQKKVAEKTTCTFHGDFRLDQNPTAYMEALELYKKLPNILKENPQNAVPIKVWLYPLFLLDTKAAQLEREISTSLVFSTEDIIEKLGEAERTCNDLSRKPIVNVFKDIKERLLLFQRSVNIYKTVLLKAVAKVLPAIRGGEMEQNSLENILKIHYSSPFNADILNQWLDHAKTELNLLSAHTEILKGIRTEDSNQLNTILFNPSIDVVVCLTFTSLKYEDPDLSTLKSFLESVEFEGLNVEKPQSSMLASITKWFNDPVIVSKMRKNLSLFRSFSENNKDEKGYRFIISAISDPSSPGSSIYLYETGNLIDTQFQPVSKPPPPEVKKVLKDSVSLKLQKSSTGETVQYRVEYQQVKADSGSEEQWIVINTDDEIFTLTGLEFGKQYMIRYRIVGKVGVSEASDTIGPIQSLQVTCELKSTTYGVRRINPEGKTIFKAGESVEITCTERYWIFGTKENIQSFTCGENGQWDHEPVCAEIRCEVPRDQYVSWPDYYFSGDKKLGARTSYACVSGYYQMSAEATCTRDGWTPKPLCAGNTCAAPNIPNAAILGDQKTIYNINSRIQYQCNPGFEPEQPVQITCTSQNQWTVIRQCTKKQKTCRDLSVVNGFTYSNTSNKEEIYYSCNTGYKSFSGNWWDSATCNKDSWSDETQCIPEDQCGAFPSVHHGKLKKTKQTFRDGDKIEFECDPGFIATPHSIRCINGKWEKPVCKVGVHCDIPPKVENALITSKPEELYVDESSVTYACRSSFSINGTSTVFCRNGIWEETPTCEEIRCKVPDDQRLVTPEQNFTDLKLGEKMSYACMTGYDKMSAEATCTRDGWTPNPLCADEVTCELKSTRFGIKRINPEGKTIFKAGESVEITCTEKHWFYGTKEKIQSFTCGENGQWDHEPVCAEVRCEVPRGQYVYDPEYYFRGDKKLGARKSYYCTSGYDQMFEATCTRDGWTPNPLCAVNTCAAPIIPNVQILGDQRTKYNINSRIQYQCNPGFKPEQPVQITCNSQKQWTGIQQCTEIRCEVPHNQHVYDLYSYFRGNEKLGAKMSYACVSGYYQMSVEATCTRDGWTPNPLCAVNTCAAPIIPNAAILGDQRIIYNINSRIQYQCNPGFEPEQPVQITCTSQNQWTGIQECTGIINENTCKVPDDHRVSRPELYFTDLKLGATISYYCMSGYYQMSAEATCTRDGWTPNPLCADGQ